MSNELFVVGAGHGVFMPMAIAPKHSAAARTLNLETLVTGRSDSTGGWAAPGIHDENGARSRTQKVVRHRCKTRSHLTHRPTLSNDDDVRM